MNDLRLNVGACIYCGDPEPPLTREHVLPRGLGGNEAPDGFANALVLQNASCQSCQKITQRIEEACLVAMMGPGRARLGLRRKDRSQNTTIAHMDRYDGPSEDREVAWDDVPGAITIPSFYEAPILTGAPIPEFPPLRLPIPHGHPCSRCARGGTSYRCFRRGGFRNVRKDAWKDWLRARCCKARHARL